MSHDTAPPVAAPATTEPRAATMIELPKRRPGRPKKYDDCAPDPSPRRPRGRPRKNTGHDADTSNSSASKSSSSALSSAPAESSVSSSSMKPSASNSSSSSSVPQRRRRAISESSEDEEDGVASKQRPAKRSGPSTSVVTSSSSSSSLAVSTSAGPKASTPPLPAPSPTPASAPLKKVTLPTLPGSAIPHQRPWDSWPAHLRTAFRGVLDTKEQGVQLAKAICDHQGGRGVWSHKTTNHYQRVTCDRKEHCEWCIEIRWEQTPDGFGNEFFVWRCVLLNSTHDHRDEKGVAVKAPPAKILAKPESIVIDDDDDDDDLTSVMTEEEEEEEEQADSSGKESGSEEEDPDADSDESTTSLSSDSEDEDYRESEHDYRMRTGRRPPSGRPVGRPRKSNSVAKPLTASNHKVAADVRPAKKPGIAKPSRFNCRREKPSKPSKPNGGHTKQGAHPTNTATAKQAPVKIPLRYAGLSRRDIEYKVVGAPEGSQRSPQSHFSQLLSNSAMASDEIRSMLRERIDRLPPVPRRGDSSSESLSSTTAATQGVELSDQPQQASASDWTHRSRGAEEGPPVRQMRPFLSAPPMEATTPPTGQGTPQSTVGEATQTKDELPVAMVARDSSALPANGHDADALSNSDMESLFSGRDDDSVEWRNASSEEDEARSGTKFQGPVAPFQESNIEVGGDSEAPAWTDVTG